MAGKGPIASAGTVIGWIVVAIVVFAIMILWNWDFVSFVVSIFDRGSDFLLGFDWFRKLVGPPA